jgi:type IV secretory pathway VirD2 relaxase
MLAQLEREAGQRLEWLAVTHEHRDHRHVHAVVVSRGHLHTGQFQAMREAGDANARAQQRQLQQQRWVVVRIEGDRNDVTCDTHGAPRQ